MAISVSDLLEAKARKFGTSKTSTQFQAQFLDAVNSALDDIENLVGVATARLTSTNGTIDIDQQRYSVVLSMGIDFYLQDSGEFAVKSLEGVDARYRDKLRTARMNYEQNESTTTHAKLGDLDD